jgi:hypothetical protein
MKLLKDAPGLELLLDQMTKIGMSDYNDHADATADCFHKAVYSIVWPSAAPETKGEISNNPFDDILKGGSRTIAAAERIAKRQSESESNYGGFSDVIFPG